MTADASAAGTSAGGGLLADQVALITGAARGQGRSHALRLAQEGADIIAIDICEDIPAIAYPMGTEQELDETARLVQERGRKVVALKADVRDGEALAAAISEGIAALGRLDIVIANAGVVSQSPDMPAWKMPYERWQTVVDVNLTGVWHTLRAAVPTMIEGGRGGAIVIASSTAGLKGMMNICDYVATKHGLVGLMRAFAKELAPYEIRVNTVHPTGVSTPMIENAMMDSARLESTAPTEDLSNMLGVPVLAPEDVSEAILWLVSPAARWVTAVTLPVDAGLTQK